MSANRKPTPAPALYRPHEIAAVLGCSEWWVKEQARKRRIPFAWIGGSYRFTPEHLTEIVRLFEVRPWEETARAARPTSSPTRTPSPPPGRRPQPSAPAPLLRAKPPRRTRQARQDTPAA